MNSELRSENLHDTAFEIRHSSFVIRNSTFICSNFIVRYSNSFLHAILQHDLCTLYSKTIETNERTGSPAGRRLSI